eukprot:Rmarinus@m.2637
MLPSESLLDVTTRFVADNLTLYFSGSCPPVMLPDALCEAMLDYLCSSRTVTDTSLMLLLRRSRPKLSLSRCSHLRKFVLRQIPYRCPALRCVDLSHCRQVTNSLVQSLLHNLPKLRQLCLDGCVRISASAFEQLPFEVSSGYLHLQVLSLAGCGQITDEVVEKLVKGCSSLRKLCLSKCRKLTDQSIQSVFDACRFLTYLDVSYCPNVTDEAFAGAAAGCPYLETLLIQSCPISDKTLKYLSRGCSRLRFLDVSSCKLVGDTGFCALARSCPNLEGIGVSCCPISDVGFRTLGEHCPALSFADLSCSHVTDEGMLAISQGCMLLRTLNLTWCSISDDGVDHLISHHRALTALEVSFCEQVSDRTVEQLSDHCPLLQHLSLRCTDVSFKAVVSLALPHLTTLRLSNCPVSEATEEPFRGLCGLRRLELDRVVLFDGLLLDLARSCPHLSELCLSCCPVVTPAGVLAFLESAPGLRTLHLHEQPEDFVPAVLAALWSAAAAGTSEDGIPVLGGGSSTHTSPTAATAAIAAVASVAAPPSGTSAAATTTATTTVTAAAAAVAAAVQQQQHHQQQQRRRQRQRRARRIREGLTSGSDPDSSANDTTDTEGPAHQKSGKATTYTLVLHGGTPLTLCTSCLLDWGLRLYPS